MTTKKIALFIDADNISAKFGKQIFDTLESRGEIFIRRIYGNWEKSSLHGWNECILNYSLRPMQQTDFATGKNATDMSLTIDAMDVLYGGKAEIFALVSNDSDFTPLAVRLREGGMNVIGLGGAQVSNSFRSACSEFIDLNPPAEIQPAQPKPKVEKKISPAPDKISPVQLSLFDEKNNPLAPPPMNSKVVSITAQNNFADKNLQMFHYTLHEAARNYGDDSGFLLLNGAGTKIKSKNLGFGVKDLGYSTLRKFISAFPDLYEIKGAGTTIAYRCRQVG